MESVRPRGLHAQRAKQVHCPEGRCLSLCPTATLVPSRPRTQSCRKCFNPRTAVRISKASPPSQRGLFGHLGHARTEFAPTAARERERRASTPHATPSGKEGDLGGKVGTDGPKDRESSVQEEQRQAGSAGYEDVLRARRVKQLGTVVSVGFLGTALGLASASGVELPSPPGWLLWLLGTPVGLAAAGYAALKVQHGDDLVVEFVDNKLYISWGAPSSGIPLEDGAVEVRPTGDGRGNGAFATTMIPEGTFLGDYEGEMLSEKEFWTRYPDGMADYCINVSDEYTVDGIERAKDTGTFSPCHMNHSRARKNAVRRAIRRELKVQFFTDRDIQPGEELLIDYGKTFWTNREDMELD